MYVDLYPFIHEIFVGCQKMTFCFRRFLYHHRMSHKASIYNEVTKLYSPHPLSKYTKSKKHVHVSFGKKIHKKIQRLTILVPVETNVCLSVDSIAM